MTLQARLVEAMASELKPLGFRRRATSLWRLGEELYSVVHVEHPPRDTSCYVSFGFALPSALGDKAFLSQVNCPVQFRLERVRAVLPSDLRLLDGPGPPVEAALDELRDRIAVPVATVMRETTNVAELRGLVHDRVTSNVFVHRDMRPVLAGTSSG